MSIIDPQSLGLIGSTNCISTVGCYPQPVYFPAEAKTVHIEKVPNGYIIKGFFKNGAEQKRVALDLAGLNVVLDEWCAGQNA